MLECFTKTFSADEIKNEIEQYMFYIEKSDEIDDTFETEIIYGNENVKQKEMVYNWFGTEKKECVINSELFDSVLDPILTEDYIYLEMAMEYGEIDFYEIDEQYLILKYINGKLISIECRIDDDEIIIDGNKNLQHNYKHAAVAFSILAAHKNCRKNYSVKSANSARV